ncbi:MAG TPA: aminotransferase class I/II-fold pyridoxal phosphate-dependent enzyme [Bryobacteraceae bacterium]|nr:aminotransferase class I/II-fold pyridoxal phosphate-dependent enzyme [Bryobacteraceae bacterium]HOQ46489.1 aminotransferase class I/II-fold pyridoxal phosphate-dependent enzyme [Bryobacteraceae bacterium]HPQ13858.1 aminotransferase class I/II-fold pyridoxal phosphate-dependent enzyme [Bryobacteraceae bacterium]HPU72646.1 aminotransferase class I/II-fold pyridoxal phosphate-dependent enzyme [Bryobacteraceae bacterium]
MEPAKLELSREEMRAFGYLVVDTLVEYFSGLRAEPAARKSSRQELESLLREPVPEKGSDPGELVRRLSETVFRSMMHLDHPRDFAFVPSPSNFVSVMADALASGYNAFVGSWFSGSGPAQIELVTIDWLRQLCGLPETAGGLFVSGGSMANLTALAAARHARLKFDFSHAAVYCSDQTHSSIERALRVLGFAPAQLRKLPSDEGFRLPLAALEREVAADRALGRLPFCVIANAGTTNTAAVDPLEELARFCAREKLWLHVDGAYGAAAVICDEGRRALAGLELADSVSLDPHKWLFQPFEIGCVLLRDASLLKNAFRIMPEYLRDVYRLPGEVNFCDYGIQLTRGFRALKLWLSLKVFGLGAFREAVARGLELARVAEARLREAGCWEIVTPAQMGIVSFRYFEPGRSEEELDAATERAAAGITASGFAALTTTTLRGRTTLRLCTINPRTTEEDIRETVARLAKYAREGGGERTGDGNPR